MLLEKWSDLRDLVNVLRIPYLATIKLQKKDLTLSDTYGIWLEIMLRLKKIVQGQLSPTGLADALLTKFESRFSVIYNNPAMKAAIYLDPRYRLGITRNEEDVNEAKQFLMDMHRRLNYLKGKPQEIAAHENRNQADDMFDVFNAQDEMNQYWTNQTTESNPNTNLHHLSDFEATLDLFDPPRMLIKDSVFEYWNSNECDKELYDVAMATYSITPCEIQCEKDFSALKRILSDHRGNLLPETLENILTINLNRKIYLDIVKKQIQNLRNVE